MGDTFESGCKLNIGFCPNLHIKKYTSDIIYCINHSETSLYNLSNLNLLQSGVDKAFCLNNPYKRQVQNHSYAEN